MSSFGISFFLDLCAHFIQILFHFISRTPFDSVEHEETSDKPSSPKGPGTSRASQWRAHLSELKGNDTHRDGPPPYLNIVEQKIALDWLTAQVKAGINPTVISFINEACIFIRKIS